MLGVDVWIQQLGDDGGQRVTALDSRALEGRIADIKFETRFRSRVSYANTVGVEQRDRKTTMISNPF